MCVPFPLTWNLSLQTYDHIHYITLHSNTLQYMTIQCITSHNKTLYRLQTKQNITLHLDLHLHLHLHYINVLLTLHYIRTYIPTA